MAQTIQRGKIKKAPATEVGQISNSSRHCGGFGALLQHDSGRE